MDSLEYDSSRPDYSASSDSTKIHIRSFSPEQLEELKNDPDLQYTEVPTIAESLWSRIKRWILGIIRYLFNKAADGTASLNWVKVLFYIGGIAALIVVIMMLLKVNAFKIFYSGDGASVRHNVIEENIHEMDFEKLIQEALQQKDYRKGVRLIFLFSLKMLSDKHYVVWEQGKTNHDYVAELAESDLKHGFNELSFYFDYAWYGNFSINADTFGKVQSLFSTWRAKVR